mgnify:CR=1 FL=1
MTGVGTAGVGTVEEVLAPATVRASQLSGKGFEKERIIFISRKDYLRFTYQPKGIFPPEGICKLNLPFGRAM